MESIDLKEKNLRLLGILRAVTAKKVSARKSTVSVFSTESNALTTVNAKIARMENPMFISKSMSRSTLLLNF